MSEIISLEESRRLVELEDIVQRGLQTFVEVGEALIEIRDSRLYRVEFATFEAYVREKWNMSIRHADRLMVGAKTVANVKETRPTGPVPSTERQARPLTKLPAEKQPEAWAKAVEIAGGEQPTAKQVEKAVETITASVETKFVPPPVEPDDSMVIAKQVMALIAGIRPGENFDRAMDTVESYCRFWRKTNGIRPAIKRAAQTVSVDEVLVWIAYLIKEVRPDLSADVLDGRKRLTDAVAEIERREAK